MSPKLRLLILLAVIVLAAGGATGYVLYTRSEQQANTRTSTVETMDLASVSTVPHLAFRSTALGNEYGRVALVPLTAPGGPRAFSPASCDRVYARPGGALCLAAQRGLVTTYRAELLGPQWTPVRTSPLTGLPSRARLSPDGSLTAFTVFVTGDSYANPGQFSTRTLVGRAGADPVDLETFRLVVDGRYVNAVDRNYWGVTFTRDNTTFYATAASGGKTWLVRGSLTSRTMTAIRPDVECPSLSPDGKRIAFKKHGSLPPGRWRLAVVELATGKETLLGEERSVDDQVEWLDDATIVYGLPRTGSGGAATSDIWAVPADGSGTPKVLVPDAWSPAVIRP